MRRAAAILPCAVAVVLALSCSRAQEAAPPPVASTHAAAIAPAPIPPPPATAGEPGSGADAAASPDTLASARSIGNTSVVFKLTFASGEKAAYKPRSKRGRDRYKGEIAAYRLAQALGVDNVPPVSFRRLVVADLERALAAQPASLDLAQKEVVADADGQVPGALIPWIEHLEFIRLESDPWKSKWRAWLLGDGAVPADEVPMAAQIAAMIAFDGVTGNWDRWSGANVGWNAKDKKLLFVDNDGAFMTPLPAPFERQRDLVRGLRKVPRALVEKLRALDPAHAKEAFGEEAPGVPLLSEAALRDFEARRQALLAVVDARVKELGAERVYAFP